MRVTPTPYSEEDPDAAKKYGGSGDLPNRGPAESPLFPLGASLCPSARARNLLSLSGLLRKVSRPTQFSQPHLDGREEDLLGTSSGLVAVQEISRTAALPSPPSSR